MENFGVGEVQLRDPANFLEIIRYFYILIDKIVFGIFFYLLYYTILFKDDLKPLNECSKETLIKFSFKYL